MDNSLLMPYQCHFIPPYFKLEPCQFKLFGSKIMLSIESERCQPYVGVNEGRFTLDHSCDLVTLNQ